MGWLGKSNRNPTFSMRDETLEHVGAGRSAERGVLKTAAYVVLLKTGRRKEYLDVNKPAVTGEYRCFRRILHSGIA